MKRIITALLLMAMGICSINAQVLGGPYMPHRLDSYDLYYSFRLGYNVSHLRFSTDAIDQNSVSGMNFGFVAGFPLGNSSVIFEPGVIYSVKGGKLKDPDINKLGLGATKSEVRMHGIEIPLVLKYDIILPTMSEISVQPFFGGFFDFGLSGKIKREYELTNKHDKLQTYSNRYKRFDAGLRMGCGVNLEFFYLELAYDLGIANLGSNSEAFTDIYPSYSDWDDKVKSGCLSINFGVNF